MIRIVVTEASPGAAEAVRTRLDADLFEIVGYARDGLEAAQMALRLNPDVLVVHEELPEVTGYRVSELVNAAKSDVGVVIIVATETDSVLRRAMASGARGVLGASTTQERYSEVLGQVAGMRGVRDEPEFPLVTDPDKMPLSIAVTAAKGGTGKTTVAVNLATLFARKYPNRVALVDFCGQFGDAALALNLFPNDSIADLASFDELDPELVNTHLATHGASTLRLLAAPDLQADARLEMDRINLPFMASLIGLLRRSFRFVFFDMSPFVWPISQYVLSRCQQVVVVGSMLDLATIRNSRTLLSLAETAVGDKHRVKLVANRASRRSDYSLADLESTTGHSVYYQLPDEPEPAVGAMNAGVPIVLESPNSGLARALTGLSEKLLSEL